MTSLLPPELIENLQASDVGNDSGVAGADVDDALNTLDTVDGTKVTGPGSATDNAVARYDLTTGKLVQDSGVIIDDTDNITGILALTAAGTITTEELVVLASTGTAVDVTLNSDLAAGTIGQITFLGHDSTSVDTNYARILANILDATNTTEDGELVVQTIQAGSLLEVGTFELGYTAIGATGGDQGVGSGNFASLFINGSAVVSGTGDVVGPGSSTDNALVRFDSTTGKLIQNSGVSIDDSDNITGVNNLTVTGDLIVNGTTTTVNTATLSIEDPLIQLANGNNTTDVVDIGMVGLYDTSGSLDLYAGLFRDASDGKWRLFVNSQEDLATASTVNIGAAGYTVATLVTNIEGDVTGQVSDLSNHDTDDLSEGATNKYASTANVNTAGAVMETDFNANTILSANADDTPLPLTMGASTIFARLAAGDAIAATPAEIRTLLNVANGSTANAWVLTLYTDPADFTAGSTTVLTMPAASTSDNEANVLVFFNGLAQHSGQWGISGTTITFTSAIPVGVTDIEIRVFTGS